MTERAEDKENATGDGLSLKERIDKWRAEMWVRYLNGEPLDVAYFDYQAAQKRDKGRSR